MIKKALILIIFILLSFEARADLVQDISKKYNLDYKNNYKDQCRLVSELHRMISDNTTSKTMGCFNNFCKSPINAYRYKNGLWEYYDGFFIVYQINPFRVVGRNIADDNLFEYEKNKNWIEKSYTFVKLDKHRNHNKAEKIYDLSDAESASLNKVALIEKEDGDIAATAYLKIRGCYIDEFKIINK